MANHKHTSRCGRGFKSHLSRFKGRLLSLCLIILVGMSVGSAARAQEPEEHYNRLYVGNFLSNTVSVIDLDVSKVVAEIPVGTGPTGMVGTPDLEHVYVANMWAGTVSVISVETDTVETTITIPSFYGKGAPFGMAVTPDGSKVFVTNIADGTVRVISTETNTLVATIIGAYDWALRYIRISPDGKYAYVVGAGEGKITVINVADYSVVAKITNLPGVRDVVVTPDGTRLYAVSDKVSRLYAIDASTYAIIAMIQFPTDAATVTIDLDPAGKFALITNYYGKVSVLDTDPLSPTYNQITAQVPPNSAYQYYAGVSPDGKSAYLTNQADRGKSPNSVNIIDLAADSPTRNTIVASIPVGQQPWWVVVIKTPTPQPPPAAKP